MTLVQAAIEEVLPALTQVTPGTFEALRVATTAAELIALGSPKVRTRHASSIDAVRKLAPESLPHREALAAVYRLRGVLERLGCEPLTVGEAMAFLPPRELVAVVNHKAHQEGARPGAGMLPRASNGALNRMEGALWGYPSDDRSHLVRMTGTLGPAYRWMLNGYLAGHVRAQPEDVVHLLACLQYSCDLRLTVLHRLARLPEALKQDTLPPLMKYLWELLRMRRLLHTALADAALFPGVDSARQKLRPHRLDPYALSSQELTQGLQGHTDLTAWSLGEVCDTLRKEGSRLAHTAAFEATCLSAWIEAEHRQELGAAPRDSMSRAERSWRPGVSRTDERHRAGTRPGQEREDSQGHRRRNGVLGLVVEPTGELMVMACWNDGHIRGQRTFRLETGLVQGGLMGALHLCDEDFASRRGSSSAMRRNAWSMVETQLAPVLESLLRVAQVRKPLRWSVLAPGALRELPLLGLRVEGKLLAHQVEALVHMPSIRFSLPPMETEAQDFTACLLARDREKGTTWFGEAAVETLRRIQPPHLVADPQETQRQSRGGGGNPGIPCLTNSHPAALWRRQGGLAQRHPGASAIGGKKSTPRPEYPRDDHASLQGG